MITNQNLETRLSRAGKAVSPSADCDQVRGAVLQHRWVQIFATITIST